MLTQAPLKSVWPPQVPKRSFLPAEGVYLAITTADMELKWYGETERQIGAGTYIIYKLQRSVIYL